MSWNIVWYTVWKRGNWELEIHDGDGNENVKKAKSYSARALRFFVLSLPSLHDYDVKSLISRFMKDVNKWRRNFLSLSELGYGREESGSRSKRTGIIAIEIERTQINFLSNIFVAVAVKFKCWAKFGNESILILIFNFCDFFFFFSQKLG